MADILFLEDDRDTGLLMRSVVEEAGHRAQVAGTLDALGAGWDIVVSDLLPLKHWNEAEARRWVNSIRERCGCPVVVCSANLPRDLEPSRIGADAIMPKPFDVETLLRKIELLIPS